MTTPSPSHVYDEEYDDDDDQNDVVDDDDVDVDDDSTSSADPPPSAVTIAVAGVLNTPEPKQTQESPALTVNEERKQLPLPIEESRKLFQRLWTDEDEIELLKGFLDYTINRSGGGHTHNSHHDTTAFYDLIKSKLQLDFNKNQLVEKLRRLKKKYRNVLSKINSGKEYVFKTSHDQVTFEISKKIWGNVGAVNRELDEDEGNGNLNLGHNLNVAFTMDDVNNSNVDGNGDCSVGKVVRSRKRSRVNVKVEEKQIDQTPIIVQPQSVAMPSQGLVNTPIVGSIPNLIEETVRSCLSPLFKVLLNNAMTGSRAGGMINSTMMGPLGNGGVLMNFAGGDLDDKWRKQQILELEVYSKRLELIQDQIKLQLEELRSMAN